MSIVRFPKISLTAWKTSTISARGRRASSSLNQPKKKKVGRCDIRAVEWMRVSFESELRHLLQIRFGIVGLDIVHIEQCE
jgi:hypothetical protein